MKKETLEEAAEKLTKDFPHYSVRDNMDDSEIKGWFLEALQKGAKSAAERMYSKKEVFSLIDRAFHMYASSKRQDAKDWLAEQFKK